MKDQLLEIIQRNDHIVIFGHINPDGDCYGSQVGLQQIILENYPGKHVYIVGTGMPRFYNKLGKMDVVSDEILKDSLAIIVDCSAFNRLEVKGAEKAKEHIIFDHHIENPDTLKCPKILDKNKIAASEIIADWALKNDLRINKIAAEALFLGITTDSGGFRYKNTTNNTFFIAGKLVETGFSVPDFYNVLQRSTERDLALQGFLLSKYKKTKNGFIYVTFAQNNIKKLGIDSNSAASRVNILANIENFPVWGTFTEYPDGVYRVELRSSGLNIQPIAVKFGGGGHANACGITRLDANLLDDLLVEIENFLKENK